MMSTRPVQVPLASAVVRLDALAPLDTEARAALAAAVQWPRAYRVRRELLAEGREVTETLLILSGWAARLRILEDGRRQIVNFLLPGDLVGLCNHDRQLASSTVIALTPVDACVAPDPGVSPALARGYALSRALDEAHLLAQVTRLGRMNAQERIADLLLELHERLELAGLATNGRYQVPITQEVLADALGLTSVHVNRTLQSLRRDGSVDWKGRDVFLPTPARLARTVGRTPTRVTAG